jgi:GGDEF domain-containing protein
MPFPLEQRRVLLVGGAVERGRLLSLFQSGQLPGWEPMEADSFERARFVLQMELCDVLVLDSGLLADGDYDGVSWLAQQDETPLLLLADTEPERIVAALQHGAHSWLTRDLALNHPNLLDAMLRKAVRWGDLRRRNDAAGDALQDCQSQVSRLVSLVWEAMPAHSRARWYTQRHMLERLEEEVARTKRHGGPLTVVLGEMRGPGLKRGMPEEVHTAAASAARRLSQAKRRSDVAGQYGLHGFILVLPRISEAEASRYCQRLRMLLEKPPALTEGPHHPLHACFGIASLSAEVATMKGLLSRAEQRLEQAKAASGEPSEL